MTSEQLHILQHSIGVDKFGQGRMDRNHFCAGGKDVDLCRSLVVLGFMVERPASELTGGDPLFHVTQAGKNAVGNESPKPPKLTRGQRRYREFLSADTGRKFGEWLKDSAAFKRTNQEAACE